MEVDQAFRAFCLSREQQTNTQALMNCCPSNQQVEETVSLPRIWAGK